MISSKSFSDIGTSNGGNRLWAYDAFEPRAPPGINGLTVSSRGRSRRSRGVRQGRARTEQIHHRVVDRRAGAACPES